MKTRFTIIAMALLMSAMQTFAQQTITVQANTSDISDNLDLRAVGILFGQANNLEEFERMLNDWENPVSNLDLNNDGYVDYLRVLESSEGDARIIVIQAVLGRDIFQDVATLIVTRDNNKPVVEIVGDPFIYGNNYIIQPVFIHTPIMFTWLWSPFHVRWWSPWYWGHFPPFFRPWHWVSFHHHYMFMSGFWRTHHHVRFHHMHHLRYDFRRSPSFNSMSRRDFSTRYPDRSFSQRNANRTTASGGAVTNRRDIDRAQSTQRINDSGRGTATNNRGGATVNNNRSDGRGTTVNTGSARGGNDNNRAGTNVGTGGSNTNRGSGTTTSPSSGSNNRGSGTTTGPSSGSNNRGSGTTTSPSSGSNNRGSGTTTSSQSSGSSNRGSGTMSGGSGSSSRGSGTSSGSSGSSSNRGSGSSGSGNRR